MAAPADQNPSRTAGDDRNLVTIDESYLAPSFEDRVMMFWEKHGRTVVAVIVLVVLALVARWAFLQFAEARERAVAAEYAAAQDSAALRAFAEARPGIPLAGAAFLRLADEAYAAGNFAAAQDDYAAALRALGSAPLGDRARLGFAISKLLAGDTAGAKTALEGLANDVAASRTLRGEAAFHLAVLDRDAGRTQEAIRWTELVLSADPSGLWAQRAMQLRMSLPEPAAPASDAVPQNAPVNPAASDEAPAAVSFPGAGG
jgi:hypothetical protein